ncbi:hypothetical protein QAD02_000308 [Eretmocerus hayati]|uniref:Uncharacterized protein n=1 Tax=Eretmocerus hayati TaxID=131215 RepID=A0ACC2NFE0_9HYME|nr:hypothetical protein QAD02_000308 [Eretmocerus hayati]
MRGGIAAIKNDVEGEARNTDYKPSLEILGLKSQDHKQIKDEQDPIKILKKLKDTRRAELNVTDTSVRTTLYNLRMRRGEKVVEFCERFDTIIREHGTCANEHPLQPHEKRSAFYQATAPIFEALAGEEASRSTLRQAP